jgi:hypothetical protein
VKAWLFGAETPVSSAIFPPEKYTANIVSDLFGEDAKYRGTLPRPRQRHPVLAVSVFLNLLKRDSDLVTELFLGVAPNAAQDAQVTASDPVDSLR